jgi:hypothetical protein
MKIDRNTQGVDIYKALKKCRWPKDKKDRWWIAGQMIGTRNQMVHILKRGVEIDAAFNKRKQIYAKPGEVFKFKFLHHYFHNGEGFVDVFQIEIISEERK